MYIYICYKLVPGPWCKTFSFSESRWLITTVAKPVTNRDESSIRSHPWWQTTTGRPHWRPRNLRWTVGPGFGYGKPWLKALPTNGLVEGTRTHDNFAHIWILRSHIAKMRSMVGQRIFKGWIWPTKSAGTSSVTLHRSRHGRLLLGRSKPTADHTFWGLAQRKDEDISLYLRQ